MSISPSKFINDSLISEIKPLEETKANAQDSIDSDIKGMAEFMDKIEKIQTEEILKERPSTRKTSGEQESTDEFIRRMMRVYEDKNYEDSKLMEEFKTCKKRVNMHSSTLVIICLIKLFEILIKTLVDCYFAINKV